MNDIPTNGGAPKDMRTSVDPASLADVPDGASGQRAVPRQRHGQAAMHDFTARQGKALRDQRGQRDSAVRPIAHERCLSNDELIAAQEARDRKVKEALARDIESKREATTRLRELRDAVAWSCYSAAERWIAGDRKGDCVISADDGLAWSELVELIALADDQLGDSAQVRPELEQEGTVDSG